MALFMLLLLCFGALAVAGKQITAAIEQARDMSDGTSVLLEVADFFCGLLLAWRFWLGLGSGLVCIAALAWVLHRVGIAEASAWMWEALMFFLPALAANQGAGLARACKLPGSTLPVSTRWLGASKTWGSYYGVFGSFAIVFVQAWVPWLQSDVIEYQSWHAAIYGVLMGLGATWGDHGESLLKRRIGIPSGEPWWPWDQTDFAVVAGLLVVPLYGIDAITKLLGFMILMLLVHPVGNSISFRLGLRSRVL